MTPERWQQVKAVFQQALERDTSERSTFVAQACGSDDALRSEVTLLLTDTHKLKVSSKRPRTKSPLISWAHKPR